MEGIRERIFSAVGDTIVSAGSNNHTNSAADHGDECSDEEGNCSPPLVLSDESNDNEHEGDEDEADGIFLFKERFSTSINLMSEIQ